MSRGSRRNRMARVEKNKGVEEGMSHMKGDILKAVRHDTRKGRGLWSCAAILVAIIFSFLAIGAWMAAATGIVSVPLFSSLAYRAPAPSHAVAPGPSFEEYLRASAGAGSLADIPEGTLTTIVRDALATNGQTWLDDHGAQAARADGGVELYLPLRDNAQGTAIVALVDVSEADGKLSVSIRHASIGSLGVPSWLVSLVLSPAIAPFVASFNETLP